VRLSSRRRGRRDAYGITTADGSHLDDVAKRQRQYAVTMAFRVVAILVVVLVPGLTVMERVILGLVATIIPYVAVIRANGGPDNSGGPTNLMVGEPRQIELPGPDLSIGGGLRVDAADPDEAAGDGSAAAGDGSAQDPADAAEDDHVTERQPYRG
jgi:hypothetical protein